MMVQWMIGLCKECGYPIRYVGYIPYGINYKGDGFDHGHICFIELNIKHVPDFAEIIDPNKPWIVMKIKKDLDVDWNKLRREGYI